MTYCTFSFFKEKDDSKERYLRNYLQLYARISRTISCESNSSEIVEAYELNQTAVVLRRDFHFKILDGALIGADENVRGLAHILNLKEIASFD